MIYAAGTVGVILGAHGVYVYFYSAKLLFGAPTYKLFFTISLPQFRDTIKWMTAQGFEHWLIPAAFILAGVLLWKFEMDIEEVIFERVLGISVV